MLPACLPQVIPLSTLSSLCPGGPGPGQVMGAWHHLGQARSLPEWAAPSFLRDGQTVLSKTSVQVVEESKQGDMAGARALRWRQSGWGAGEEARASGTGAAREHGPHPQSHGKSLEVLGKGVTF